jgi:hypothetical protein
MATTDGVPLFVEAEHKRAGSLRARIVWQGQNEWIGGIIAVARPGETLHD